MVLRGIGLLFALARDPLIIFRLVFANRADSGLKESKALLVQFVMGELAVGGLTPIAYG